MYSNGNVKPHPKEWSLFYQNTTKEQTKFLSKVFSILHKTQPVKQYLAKISE